MESYLDEAQKAIRRPIRVSEMPDTRVELGLTTVKPDEVLIQIQNGLPHDLRDDVLAHELGHVLLRARGFHGGRGGLTQAGMNRNRTFMMVTAETISNCYEDPLADAEATKHGFHPERIGDFIASGVEQQATMFDIYAREKDDELWPNYEATYLYCIELRPHMFKESELEQKFAVEPKIGKLKHKLTKELGASRCRSPRECFERSKHLRDVAGFGGLITLSDPISGVQE